MTEQKTPEQRLEEIVERIGWGEGGGYKYELTQAIKEAAQVFADIARQPYSDEVAVIHGEEPSVIGKKIAMAILEATEKL